MYVLHRVRNVCLIHEYKFECIYIFYIKQGRFSFIHLWCLAGAKKGARCKFDRTLSVHCVPL